MFALLNLEELVDLYESSSVVELAELVALVEVDEVVENAETVVVVGVEVVVVEMVEVDQKWINLLIKLVIVCWL